MIGQPVPNFLIVGAAKAGTTSLYAWLKQHPQVFLSDVKEPCFFVEGYRGGFHDWAAYLDLFRGADPSAAIGEASTAYLASPESPAWIRRCLGDVRIIVSLRNPIERAWSMYSWMVMEGYENISEFGAALDRETERRDSQRFRWTNPEYWRDYLYYECGLYTEQVERYRAIFSQVHIVLFDDLVAKPAAVFDGLCGFLGIDASVEPVFSAENRSLFPRLAGLQHTLRATRDAIRNLPLNGAFKETPLSAIAAAMELNVRHGTRHTLPPSTRPRLRAGYADEVARLSALLDRNLSSWLD